MSWLVSRTATWSGIPAVVSTMRSMTPSARCKQLVPWSILTMSVKREQLHDFKLPVHSVAFYFSFYFSLNSYLGVAQHSRIYITNEDEFWHYKSQLVEALFLPILLSPRAVKCTSECLRFYINCCMFSCSFFILIYFLLNLFFFSRRSWYIGAQTKRLQQSFRKGKLTSCRVDLLGCSSTPHKTHLPSRSP